MERRDWTLLAISFKGGEPMAPVELQKTLFLLGQRRKAGVGKGFYEFVPYHYGPFCRDIYQDADLLEEEGLVHIERGRWSEYIITSEGSRRAEAISKTAPRDAVDFLRRAVEWASGLSFDELVRAIYKQFPAQRRNSVFRG